MVFSRSDGKSLDREFYFSDEIYHQELENIFHSDWICCGREEDIDSIGSYKIFEIGNENSFIIKDKNNDIRVFIIFVSTEVVKFLGMKNQAL